MVSIRNGPFKKGDLKIGDYLVEAKETDKNSFSVKREIFEKVEKNARRQSLKPAVLVNVAGSEYIILRFQDFIELLEKKEVVK